MAIKMEEKLRANDHKGGWKGEFPQWLLNRLREEVEELDEAVDQIRATGNLDDFDGLAESVWAEAADVGNFAMMVADVATMEREE